MIPHVTDGTFDIEVLESSLPVLVDFTADWCPPCRAIAPVLEALDAETPGLSIVQLDIDANPTTTARHSVQGLPTLILFRAGVEELRIVGAQPLGRLRSVLAPALEEAAGRAAVS